MCILEKLNCAIDELKWKVNLPHKIKTKKRGMSAPGTPECIAVHLSQVRKCLIGFGMMYSLFIYRV